MGRMTKHATDAVLPIVCGLALVAAIFLAGCRESDEDAVFRQPTSERLSAAEDRESATPTPYVRGERSGESAAAGRSFEEDPEAATQDREGAGGIPATPRRAPEAGAEDENEAEDEDEAGGETDPRTPGLGAATTVPAGESVAARRGDAPCDPADDPSARIEEMDRRISELKDKIAAMPETTGRPGDDGSGAATGSGASADEPAREGSGATPRIVRSDIEWLDRRADEVRSELETLRAKIDRLEREVNEVAGRVPATP